MAKVIKNKQYNEFWEDESLDVKKVEKNKKETEEKASTEEIKKLEKKLTKKVSGLQKEIKELKEEKETKIEEEIKPVNPPRGWHSKNEFIDEVGNKFEKGVYVGKVEEEIQEPVDEELPWEKEDRTEEDIKILKDIVSEVKSPVKKEVKPKPKPIQKKVEPKVEEPKKHIPLTNKEIYQQYIIDNIPFKMYFRGKLLFDSKVQPQKNYPIFQDDGFILFGKNYIYRGIRIEKY
jgi:hypothetical protein